MTAHTRLTIIATDHASFALGDYERASHRKTFFIDARSSLQRSLLAALTEETLDVERVIIGGGTAEAFLELLAATPAQFGGDIIRIDDRGRAFLSASARGGSRVLYSLDAVDLRFYLDAHALDAIPRLEKTA